MDIKQIKQVIELMKRAELNEFSVEEEGFKLKIRRGGSGRSNGGGRNSSPPFIVATEPAVHTAAPMTAAPTPTAPTMPASPEAGEDEPGIIYIKSPMVGTFYQSPSPESKAFIEVGAKVNETTVVCIIEAMKIMNEIQAEVKGTVVEVLASDGDPIEYGQKLFKVKAG